MSKKTKITTRSRKMEAFINYKYNNNDYYGYDLYDEEQTTILTEKRYYSEDRDVMEEKEYNPINADGIMFGCELEDWEKW